VAGTPVTVDEFADLNPYSAPTPDIIRCIAKLASCAACISTDPWAQVRMHIIKVGTAPAKTKLKIATATIISDKVQP